MLNPIFQCKDCKKEAKPQDKICIFCSSDLTKGRLIQFNPFAPLRSPDEVSKNLSTAKAEILQHFDKYKTNGVRDEADVIFILSEARKILDRYRDKENIDPTAIKLKNKYQDLWFYCSWALHPKIGFELRATKLLQSVDNEVSEYVKRYPPENRVASNAVRELLIDFVSLNELRYLLTDFFEGYGVTLVPFSNDKEWLRFASYFLRLVIDSELKTKENLVNIESIYFQRIKDTQIYKDDYVELGVPNFEDSEGHINIVVKLKEVGIAKAGDLFAMAIILPRDIG